MPNAIIKYTSCAIVFLTLWEEAEDQCSPSSAAYWSHWTSQGSVSLSIKGRHQLPVYPPWRVMKIKWSDVWENCKTWALLKKDRKFKKKNLKREVNSLGKEKATEQEPSASRESIPTGTHSCLVSGWKLSEAMVTRPRHISSKWKY